MQSDGRDEADDLPWFKCQRYRPPMLCFFGILVMYLYRLSISSAVPVMASIFGWSKVQEGYIHSSFYAGYLITQVLGGVMSRRYGGKRVALAGQIVMCVANLLVPLAAGTSFVLLLLTRVALGLSAGVMYTSMLEVLTRWMIASEKSRLISFSWSGAQIGTILVYVTYASMTQQFSWYVPFCVYSAIGLLWIVLWYLLIFETPAQNPHITPAERQLIEVNRVRAEEPTKRAIPWRILLTSPPVLVFAVIYFVYNWMFYLFSSYLVTFLITVMGYTGTFQGLLAMTPSIGLWVSTNASSYLSDWLVNRGWTTRSVRRLMLASGFLPAAFCLLLLSVYSSVPLVMGMIFMSMTFAGLSISGYTPNPVDLSPEFASIITGMGSALGGLAGIFCPIVVGWFRTYGGCTGAYPEPDSCILVWNHMFRLGALVYLFGTGLWLLFSSTDPLVLDAKEPDQTGRK